jgi:acetylglutamate kinase
MFTAQTKAYKTKIIQVDKQCCQAQAKDVNVLKGKIMVVKLGGSTLENQRAVMQDLIWLQTLGVHPVLVHGGGPSINAWLETLHIPSHFEHGLRVTDEQTLEVVSMVLRGQVNAHLVMLAAELGAKAVGLSGTDGNMIHAHITDQSLGLVGDVDAVDPELLLDLLEQGYLPIIAPLGLSDEKGCLNVNADLVAASLASALGAARLVFLSDVPGVRGVDGALLTRLNEAEAQHLIDLGVISGGMIPKITACLQALAGGTSVHIVDGANPHILLREIEPVLQVGTLIAQS